MPKLPKMANLTSFWEPEACGQLVLPDTKQVDQFSNNVQFWFVISIFVMLKLIWPMMRNEIEIEITPCDLQNNVYLAGALWWFDETHFSSSNHI